MVQDEKQTELCLRILQTCRAELCDLFPYLDAAFDCLRWRLGAETGFSVDGQAMYFPVRETLKCYSREPAALRRGYLHMLLHCLYLHLFQEDPVPASVQTGGGNVGSCLRYGGGADD